MRNGISAKISERLRERLPHTYDILARSGLKVHPYVRKVVLTGSRGLAHCPRPDSDMDLSLLLQRDCMRPEESEEDVLKEVLQVTCSSWQSSVELDTATIFDIANCRLTCFDCETFAERHCKDKGIDCFGIYKLQEGFHGYVPKIGINIERVYPMIVVYERPQP